MNIFVTGGFGFIGSALIKQLINVTDHEVLNIDKETYASMPESLAKIRGNKNYSFKKIDINLARDLYKVFNEFAPNTVIHLAAESHVDRSIVGSKEFINTNIIGTYNLLEAARNSWGESLSNKKFLHVSTDEVFGSLTKEERPFIEEDKYYPNSPYSASKASSDLLVRAWSVTYNLPTIVTNCSNNYGPWQFPEKFIPVIISNAIEGKRIPVYGKGENIRDWIFVEDHVKALIEIVESNIVNSTFNIGADQEISNLNLVKFICSILDEFEPKIDQSSYVSQIEFVRDRPGHDFRYAINSTKIKEDLGVTFENDLENGLRKTVKWYLENRDWLKSKNI